jgi:hypothetical protein
MGPNAPVRDPKSDHADMRYLSQIDIKQVKTLLRTPDDELDAIETDQCLSFGGGSSAENRR